MLSSLILCNNNGPFLNPIVTFTEKWIFTVDFQPVVAGWSEKTLQSTSQSQTCTKKKVMVTLVVCCSSDPLQLSESRRNHYIWEACSANWWAAPKTAVIQQLALVSRMGPILHDNALPHLAQPVLQKLNELDCEVSPHLPYSPDLLPTDYHFSKHLNNFLQRKCFHNQQDAGKVFQEFIKS